MAQLGESATINGKGGFVQDWAADKQGTGGGITYFELDPKTMRPARMGAGQTHHIALSVADDATQLEFAERLRSAGYRVSPVMDRTYFRSVYSADPDGHIVEIATAGPGFAIDEAASELGTNLMLPPELEPQRGEISQLLPGFKAPAWKGMGECWNSCMQER